MGVLSRPESGGSGVYFLTGVDPASGRSAIYVGEAENIRDRVKTHLERDFWNQILYFTSKDENLTKAHIRYLEGKLIEQARKAGRSVVVNGQSSGARLPESDREDMDIFLEKVSQLLPVLGVELLVPPAAPIVGEWEQRSNPGDRPRSAGLATLAFTSTSSQPPGQPSHVGPVDQALELGPQRSREDSVLK